MPELQSNAARKAGQVESGVELRCPATPVPSVEATPQQDLEVDIQTVALRTYGGVEMTTRECAPENPQQLRAAFALAETNGWRVTFRAGGHAMDTQSLNDELVISLRNFNDINVNQAAQTVTVGAGAIWGNILAATRACSLVPYVMVTTSTASAGGTLAADSLSRFSPTCGKEGQHIERFVLVTPNRKVYECSRTKYPALFKAVIAGLGYVGAVVEITYRLLPLPFAPENIAVKTEFELVSGLRDIARRLVQHVRRVHGPGGRDAFSAAWCATTDPESMVRAVSAAVHMQKVPRGLLANSKYVSCPPDKLNPSNFHTPRSFGHLLLQFAALIPFLRKLAYMLVFNVIYRNAQRRVYVDELAGYTFFEDGNQRVKTILRRLGAPAGMCQQTFVIPWDPRNAERSERKLAEFMEQAHALLVERRIDVTFIDVVYVPDDGGDGFLLSSSRGLSGFAVSFSFEKLFSARFEEVESALRSISELCESFDGRVHLVKNVHADAEVLRRMYDWGPEKMAEVRKAVGAHDMLANEFLQRTFPALMPKAES